MKPRTIHNPLPRRKLLGIILASTLAAHPLFASGLPTAQVNTTGLAVTDTTVTVGQLHSATGTMAISETGSIPAEQLAIDQINAAGGVFRGAMNIYSLNSSTRLCS